MTDNFWQNRWQTGNTPWDLGGAHPLINDLIEMATDWGELREGATIWVPGCGIGHDAAWLAARGYVVTASDLVPEAIAAAEARHGESGVTFVVDDVLHTKFAEGTFDAIFDRAMMLALPRPLREEYVRQVARALKPEGLFMSIAFTRVGKTEEQGPPFAMSVADLEVMLRPCFDFMYGCEREDGAIDEVVLMEMLGLWTVRKGD